jgi:hypothetical protein
VIRQKGSIDIPFMGRVVTEARVLPSLVRNRELIFTRKTRTPTGVVTERSARVRVIDFSAFFANREIVERVIYLPSRKVNRTRGARRPGVPAEETAKKEAEGLQCGSIHRTKIEH